MLTMRAREKKTVRNVGRGWREVGRREVSSHWVGGGIECSALKVGRREKLRKK